MTNFRRLPLTFDPAAALAQLAEHDGLWGHHPARIDAPRSPHAQSLDIWLRFRPEGELQEPADYDRPHFPSFWPAWWLLPALHSVAFDIARIVEAVSIGTILLTKMPPGTSILPHVDTGWVPRFNNTKAYAILQANPGCLNFCGGEMVTMAPGEVWLFRNDIAHSVENHGSTDRIALIVTMRTETRP